MRNLFWGVTFVIIGVLLLLDNLGVADFADILHDYWPLILVVWGASILYRRKEPVQPAAVPPVAPPGSPSIGTTGADQPWSAGQTAQTPPSQGLPTELIEESHVFGNMTYRILSDRFKGGSISGVFGDTRLDLSGSTIAEGDHELKIHGVFGNTVIILPPNAPVAIAASALAGTLTIMGERKSGFSPELSRTSQTYAAASGRLRITLSKVFGDARIE